MPAAACPTAARSVFAVTRDIISSALSKPVAANSSGVSLWSSPSFNEVGSLMPPPAAIAPGPAGFSAAFFFPFWPCCFGFGVAMEASSSAYSSLSQVYGTCCSNYVPTVGPARLSSRRRQLSWPPCQRLSTSFALSHLPTSLPPSSPNQMPLSVD